jgi:hypothetical protein
VRGARALDLVPLGAMWSLLACEAYLLLLGVQGDQGMVGRPA